MTKSGKKASSKVSLKDFHKAVPGKVSPEHDLPSKPLGRNGSAYISTSTEKPAAAAGAAQPVAITSSNNSSAADAAAEAARFEPYCNLLKPQRPTVLSPVAKEPQDIPLRPQLGPSSLAPPTPHPQQHPHQHHHQTPDPSATVSIQIDCQPVNLPPGAVVLSGLSPGSLGYSNSFPSATAGAFGNSNDSSSWRNPPSSQQQQQQPRQWATEVLVQKQQQQQRLVAAPRQLQMRPQQPQQQPAAAPKALSSHMGKSSSGPWAEEAAQIAKAQLANSSSGLVEEKKPQPALVKPSDPGQRPVLKIQPRTKPVEIPSAAAAPQGASKSPTSSSSKSLSSSQSSHSSEVAAAAAAATAAANVTSEPSATKPSAAARPKLNLKPRSKPLEEDSSLGGRRSSPFGEALPREVILNKRGEPVRPGDDPFDAPQAPVSSKGSAQSGWHTVHHRKSGGGHGGAAGGAKGGAPLSDDPFFGDYVPPGRSFSALVSSFEQQQQPQYGLGGFGRGPLSPPSNCSTEADANPFTKRALPMRSDDYF